MGLLDLFRKKPVTRAADPAPVLAPIPDVISDIGQGKGVSHFTEVILASLRLGRAIKEAAADDGKISYLEMIGMAKPAISFLGAARQYGIIVEELKDIQPPEIDQIAQALLPELDGLTAAETEDLVGEALLFLSATTRFVRAVESYRKK